MPISFKDFIMEEKVNFHSQLKALGKSFYQHGGSSSVSTTRFQGDKNNHLDTIHKMVTNDGYKKVHSDTYGTEYHKKLNDGKRTAQVKINHNGSHVYSVDTITYLNHY